MHRIRGRLLTGGEIRKAHWLFVTPVNIGEVSMDFRDFLDFVWISFLLS